ncbi:MAG: aminoacetone oxidase family FAD-binding enzyme [Atopobiaceae bacterium]
MSRQRAPKSRTSAKHQQLAQAAQVRLPCTCDVAIAGGGAAGLVAAICAAEDGASVVVLERAPECGRTILATGNGRCNFCNADLAPSHYNDPPFVKRVCGASHLDDVLGFFAQCGMAWTQEDGRLYPISRQASSVRDVLLARARRAGAILAPARQVRHVARMPRGFRVDMLGLYSEDQPHESLGAGAVILACGGGEFPGVQDLGLRLSACRPVLCSLACEDGPLHVLDGRRAHAELTLWRKGSPLCRQRGEVLFRDYGLSGIVVFDLSRTAQPGDEITVDLLPGMAQPEAERLAKAAGFLDGLVDPVISQVITPLASMCWWPSHMQAKAPYTGTGQLPHALQLARRLPFRVTGLADPKRAQVTRGGLATSQFDPSTLECTSATGVFACGESLDVDGACGGYNLAWAWKSGMVAGHAAARRSRGKDPHSC